MHPYPFVPIHVGGHIAKLLESETKFLPFSSIAYPPHLSGLYASEGGAIHDMRL